VALSQFDLSELLDALRAGESVDVIRASVEMVLQALIDAEAAEVIGAAPHERSSTRTNQRNGTRAKLVTTKPATSRSRSRSCDMAAPSPRFSSGDVGSIGRCSRW
jgi:hypothetical protein